MKRIVLIPARMASTRLPGKPMLCIAGQPLVSLVYQVAVRSTADEVSVVTPDFEIKKYCELKQIHCIFQQQGDYSSGTARCAAALQQLNAGNAAVINLQVDEPLVSPTSLDDLFRATETWPSQIHTLVGQLPADAVNDPNVVKCVVLGSYCHWFSRAPMAGSLQHVGVYAYRANVLQTIGKLPPDPFATAEGLEQLTWLVTGHKIRPTFVSRPSLSINTLEDAKQAERLLGDE